MKKHLLYSLSLVIALLVTSCSTSKVVSTSRILEPTTNPVYADLDIKTQKVTGVFNYECKKNAPVNEKEMRDNAVYVALKDLNADVLVAPMYQINTKVMGKKYVTVTVSGYPAFYKNFRSVEPAEFASLETVESNNGVVILVGKDQNEKVLGYQVIVSADKSVNTIDMDMMTLDKIIFDGHQQQVGSFVEVTQPSGEAKAFNPFSKLMGKKANKEKNKSKKSKK
ncbi:MAG: hypothetical protein K6A41_01355 [Bacteroidales bacterium]|nr:hypothetical protein [Bacteroidales bacterium]